ncbi:MAG: mechanosensitive ion channel family protein [Spirochaetales bacterium]|nr:mechanosensitive ion channel family protein [Spirochaetales bacterium]
MSIQERFAEFFTKERLTVIIEVAVILVAGLLLVRIIAGIVRKVFKKTLNEQTRIVVTKIISYTGNSIVILLALSQAGAKLSAVLGAAGVMGIAIGIASQTSLSNIISGLFLVSEKTFQIGDVIRIGEITGVVDSIDLLSVKIRTFDNLYVRFPNSKIISQEMTNITRFPLRRMDFNLEIPFQTDLSLVKKVLLDLAFREVLCLNNPEPLIIFTEFSQDGIKLLFGIWFDKSDYVQARNNMFEGIMTTFREHDIEIAIPRIALYTEGKTVRKQGRAKSGRRED